MKWPNLQKWVTKLTPQKGSMNKTFHDQFKITLKEGCLNEERYTQKHLFTLSIRCPTQNINCKKFVRSSVNARKKLSKEKKLA
jgi:hypothetical protein